MNHWHNKNSSELAALVEYHNLRYWVLNAPEISDSDYDLLVEALREKSPDARQLDEVKSIEVSSSKIRHSVPMLSLQKAYSFEEVKKWMDKLSRSEKEMFSFSPKYDGVAGNWDGKILSTRGDGYEGDDISDKSGIITVHSAGNAPEPLLRYSKAVRGEIVMTCDEFEKHKCEFKTPRAAAAGLLGRNTVSDRYALTFAVYDAHEKTFSADMVDEKLFETLCKEFASLPYPQDGVVIRLADREYRDSLGHTAHHPNGAVAYKTGSSGLRSRIENIIWQINRQDITPVAQITPVKIGNRTVKRVTLHSAKYVMDNDIRCGDVVQVILSGDVIPKIVSVEKGETRKSVMITRCPACGAELAWRDERIFCNNPECEAVIKAALLDFGQKLNLKGFGKIAVDYLYNLGVRSREDMADKLLFFRNYGFETLLPATEAVKKLLTADTMLTEVQKLIACDVFMLGESLARTLCGKYTVKQIFEHAGNTEFFRKNLPPPARAETIARSMTERVELYRKIEALCNDSIYKRGVPAGVVRSVNAPGFPDLDIRNVRKTGNGKIVCLTGRMPWVRAELFKICSAAGYIPVDRYSSSVDLVVYADANSGSSKLVSAMRAGKATEHITDFVKRINAVT